MENAGLIRPTTVQVSAIGGEGGGVLSSWIVEAAKRAGFPVQSTSIPGVAQRTGATIYYIEVFPLPLESLGNDRPVMALYPGVGDIDIMVASEIIEAGRAIANGFVTPDRTHLIASTHRVYAIGERSDMADGRYDLKRLNDAALKRAKKSYLADLLQVSKQNHVSLNAVLLGALAGIKRLPMGVQDYTAAIEASGIAVQSNLKGFDIGYGFKFTQEAKTFAENPTTQNLKSKKQGRREEEICESFPEICYDIILEGARRLENYQDEAYAQDYLERLSVILKKEKDTGGNGGVTAEAGRQLALRMTYEDVIRVAQLKSMSGRLERVRKEIKAEKSQPIMVVDYLKPGIEELCSILPVGVGRYLMRLAINGGWRERSNFAIHLKSTTILGYLILRLLACLRCWRRGTYRYFEEQKSIGRWLADIEAAFTISHKFALEIVECARLIKGYGETHRRGSKNFESIREMIILPTFSGNLDSEIALDAITNARVAALSDPEGEKLDIVLSEISNLVEQNPSK